MTRGLAVALWIAGLAACGGQDGPPPRAIDPSEAYRGSFSPAPSPDAVVIAEVNGEKIYDEDVARQARARGLSAREALDELVAAELLAQEARRRGLADDPDVIEARRRERVRVLTERDFVPTFDGPEDVPQAALDSAWKNPAVRNYYQHEQVQKIVYLRVPAENVGAAEEDAARRLAEAIHAHLVAKPPRDQEEFGHLADEIAGPAGVKLRKAAGQTRRKGDTVEEFAAAAFSLTQAGTFTAPFRTKWGWDIIYLVELVPARNVPREEAEKEIREKIFADTRRLAFVRWAEGLAAGYRIVRAPDWEGWLERIAVEAPVAATAPAAP